jgi:hypothetical protein
LERGKKLTEHLIQFAYQRAQAVASLAKNPIGADMSDTTSILLELGKAIPGATVGLMNADKARKGLEYAQLGADAFEKSYGVMKTGGESGWQAATVKFLGDGLELGLGLATGNPLSALAGTIVGSFAEIGISNMARILHGRRLAGSDPSNHGPPEFSQSSRVGQNRILDRQTVERANLFLFSARVAGIYRHPQHDDLGAEPASQATQTTRRLCPRMERRSTGAIPAVSVL